MLVACWEPTETDDHGMVGQIIDVGGNPVSGVLVASLEAQQITDEAGQFAVQYKPPETLVNFEYRGVHYQRVYQPAVDARRVSIQLPGLRDVSASCELDVPCDLFVKWDLGSGLSASTSAACEPGKAVTLSGVPRQIPEVSCNNEVGLVNRALDRHPQVRVEERGEGWVILPPRMPVRVEIRTDDRPPSECAVQIGDRVAAPLGKGLFIAEVSGEVTATAICDGRPGLPRTFVVAEGQTLPVEWSSQGPTLDLVALLPGAEKAWVVSESEKPGWLLEIAASADGTFALPSLPPGLYRIGAGDSGRMALEAVPPNLEAGALTLAGDSTASVVGFLKLDADLVEGVVPLRSR